MCLTVYFGFCFKEATMISIIVPVYNTVDYIDSCISSILSQTYGDIEIIVIDDCSNDGSSEKVDYWAQKDERIRVVHKNANKGVSDSRNMGLYLAKGDYIGFVDSDDWIEPEMYESLYCLIKNSYADVAFCGYNRVMKDKTRITFPDYSMGTIVSREKALLYCIPQRDEGRYDLFIWDKLFSRKAIMNEGLPILFDKDVWYCEDVLWLINVLLKCERIVLCNKSLYNYRVGRIGNTWSKISGHENLEYCNQALRSNSLIYKKLKDAKSLSANNAFQRVLFYQKYAIETSIQLGNTVKFREYSKGYLRDVIKWFIKNRTWIGFKWSVRQLRDYVKSTVKSVGMNNHP